MSLTKNKKVKVKFDDDDWANIEFETIYEGEFEFEIDDDDDDYNLENIKLISFKNCLMIDFPYFGCLSSLAPNFNALRIKNSKLERIESGQLEGFQQLVHLDFAYSSIDELPGDLFIHTPNLQLISFACNKIKVIGEGILDPLVNPISFNLRGNPGIDAHYHAMYGGIHQYKTLDQFKEAIKRCKPTQEVWKMVDEQKKEIDALKELCINQNAQINKDYETLKKELAELKQAGAFQKFDFSIKVNGKEFKVQKKLLIDNSPLLAKMIRENEDADTLELKDISEEAFEEILIFMYTKQPPKPTTNFIELYAASGRLQMKELMDLCARMLIDKVTPENAYKIFNLSKKNGNLILEKKAFNELKKSYEK